jgi:MOSC domain-containing protein YiiM
LRQYGGVSRTAWKAAPVAAAAKAGKAGEMSGRVEGIATKEAKRAAMVPVDRAKVSVETGVAGDWRGVQKTRQVTVLFAEDWALAVARLDRAAPWTIRRATLLVSGIENRKRVGDVLAIGDVRLVVTGETRPCKRMDEQLPGLWDALRPDWRGGVTAQVTCGGDISVGDEVMWLPAETGVRN